jgi:hypothetical protein
MQPLLTFLSANKDAISSAGTIFALAVFAFAVFQYRRGESWKKSEFIAKLYKDFIDDADCQRAMWMLDWFDREINFGLSSKGESLIEVCSSVVVAKALRKHSIAPFTEVEVKIRDTFDRFFLYIEQFERAMQNKLIRERQVYPYFAYWIDLLSGKRHLSPALQTAILSYISEYGYRDVERFLGRWPK